MNIDNLLKELQETLDKEFKNNFTGMVLFGSYAKKTQKPNSDLDLILTFKRLPENKIERTELIYDIIDNLEDKYKIEINPITTQENELGKSILLLEICDYAKIIVDKNNKIKKLFKSITDDYKKGFVKKLWYGNKHLLKFENV